LQKRVGNRTARHAENASVQTVPSHFSDLSWPDAIFRVQQNSSAQFLEIQKLCTGLETKRWRLSEKNGKLVEQKASAFVQENRNSLFAKMHYLT
jgi:hypothetical protein